MLHLKIFRIRQMLKPLTLTETHQSTYYVQLPQGSPPAVKIGNCDFPLKNDLSSTYLLEIPAHQSCMKGNQVKKR